MLKINDAHWLVIINFMEKHPQFARGQFIGPAGKITQKKLWEQLALELNSLGYGSKPVEKWQKTWSDIKYVLKKKAASLKIDMNKTGGGPPTTKKLNDYEERILSILGKTFAVGVGSSECGIPHEVFEISQTEDSISFPLQELQEPEMEVMEREVPERVVVSGCSKEPNQYANSTVQMTDPSMVLSGCSIKSNQIVNPTCQVLNPPVGVPSSSKEPKQNKNVTLRVPNPPDHNYTDIKLKARKQTAEEMENDLYKKTLDELRSIKNGVINIGANLSDLNNTLQEIKEILKNK